MNSILDQTLKDLEVIIVDDGMSTENRGFILSLKDSRVRVIKNEGRSGLTAALNYGLAASKGRYVARQDSDDHSTPGRLEKQLKFFEEDPNTLLVGSAFVNHYPDGSEKAFLVGFDDGDLPGILRYGNPLAHSSLAFRREWNGNPVRYAADFIYAQDYELIVRLAAMGRIRVIPEVLVFRHVGFGSLSVKHRRTQMRFALRSRARAILRFGFEWMALFRLFRSAIASLLPDSLYRRLGGVHRGI